VIRSIALLQFFLIAFSLGAEAADLDLAKKEGEGVLYTIQLRVESKSRKGDEGSYYPDG